MRITSRREVLSSKDRVSTGAAKIPAVSSDTQYDTQLRESQAIEDRVEYVHSSEELEQQLAQAGDSLVVLEVMADEVCETGLNEPDEGWSPDRAEKEELKLKKCTEIKHHYMRMAADSPEVKFIALVDDVDGPARQLVRSLDVKLLPSMLFFRRGEMVWRSSGSHTMEEDMLEGVLYFGDSAGKGFKASKYVRELADAAGFREFTQSQSGAPLKCVMISADMCSPCVHIYPSMVRLAMNFTGVVDFAKIEGDDSTEVTELFQELNILEVPCFLTYYQQKEISRNISGNRGDLIGHLLDDITKCGITPPKPSGRS